MQLKLATTRSFNGNELACYTEEKPASAGKARTDEPKTYQIDNSLFVA